MVIFDHHQEAEEAGDAANIRLSLKEGGYRRKARTIFRRCYMKDRFHWSLKDGLLSQALFMVIFDHHQ